MALFADALSGSFIASLYAGLAHCFACSGAIDGLEGMLILVQYSIRIVKFRRVSRESQKN